MNNYVEALAWDGINLYAGGNFSSAGGSIASIASFEIMHTVTATAGDNGNITPTSTTVSHDTTKEFIVTPDSGYRIDSVTGCGGSLSGDIYTTGPVKADCEITATFTRITHTLTITVDGSGKVEDDKDPQFICPSGVCGQGYDEGTVVSLTATPDPGNVFVEWQGNCSGAGTCSVTMSEPRSVTAVFAVATPLNDDTEFVKQVYRDFLNREDRKSVV